MTNFAAAAAGDADVDADANAAAASFVFHLLICHEYQWRVYFSQMFRFIRCNEK